VSAIVLPTLAAPAPTITEARARGAMAVSPQNTFFANYFGLPAVNVPIGCRDDGRLPMGVQFVGPQGGDAEVLALARAYQRAIGWRSAPPSSISTQMTAHVG
jgi:aspartyl-tRNA(Asn)/glutamyl-tRNA(Gln) amidotransferase subunit A